MIELKDSPANLLDLQRSIMAEAAAQKKTTEPPTVAQDKLADPKNTLEDLRRALDNVERLLANNPVSETPKPRKLPAVALGEAPDSSAPPSDETTPQSTEKGIPDEFKQFAVDHVEHETYPEGDLAVGYKNGKETAILLGSGLYVNLDATEAKRHVADGNLPRQGEAGWYKVEDSGKYRKLKYDAMSFNKDSREFVSQLTDDLSHSYKKEKQPERFVLTIQTDRLNILKLSLKDHLKKLLQREYGTDLTLQKGSLVWT